MSDTSWNTWVKAQGVVVAGEQKNPICLSAVTSNNQTVAFTTGDFIGELSDLGEFGAQRSTTEINGYRYDSAAKLAGNSTPNDLQLTLNLTTDDLTLMRSYYDNQTKLGVGIFDIGPDYDLIYGCIGTISQWGATVPNGDVASLTVTIAIINDNVAHTFTTSTP